MAVNMEGGACGLGPQENSRHELYTYRSISLLFFVVGKVLERVVVVGWAVAELVTCWSVWRL